MFRVRVVCSLYCDMVWENMNASHTHHTHTYTHTVWHHVNNTVMQSVACVCVCPWAAPLLQVAATVTSQGYSAQTSSLWRCVVLVQGGAWGNVWGWGRGHAMTQWIGVCVWFPTVNLLSHLSDRCRFESLPFIPLLWTCFSFITLPFNLGFI